MQSKEESKYWKGYIKRDTEAQQICKECKYRIKIIEQKLQELQEEYKEKLEKNSTKAFILKCQIEILEEVLGRSKNSH